MGLCFPPPATVLHLTLSSSARIVDIRLLASTTDRVLLCAGSEQTLKTLFLEVLPWERRNRFRANKTLNTKILRTRTSGGFGVMRS